MKRLPHVIVTLALIFGAWPAPAHAGQAGTDDLAAVPRISQGELSQLLATGRVLLLDVRDEDSYKAGHIPGARPLPLPDISSRSAATAALRAEKRPIVTYCA